LNEVKKMMINEERLVLIIIQLVTSSFVRD